MLKTFNSVKVNNKDKESALFLSNRTLPDRINRVTNFVIADDYDRALKELESIKNDLIELEKLCDKLS